MGTSAGTERGQRIEAKRDRLQGGKLIPSFVGPRARSGRTRYPICPRFLARTIVTVTRVVRAGSSDPRRRCEEAAQDAAGDARRADLLAIFVQDGDELGQPRQSANAYAPPSLRSRLTCPRAAAPAEPPRAHQRRRRRHPPNQCPVRGGTTTVSRACLEMPASEAELHPAFEHCEARFLTRMNVARGNMRARGKVEVELENPSAGSQACFRITMRSPLNAFAITSPCASLIGSDCSQSWYGSSDDEHDEAERNNAEHRAVVHEVELHRPAPRRRCRAPRPRWDSVGHHAPDPRRS